MQRHGSMRSRGVLSYGITEKLSEKCSVGGGNPPPRGLTPFIGERVFREFHRSQTWTCPENNGVLSSARPARFRRINSRNY